MQYQTPGDELVALLDAPLTPLSTLSPDRSHLLLIGYEAYPPIADLARPYEKLAGVRFDPTRPGTQRHTRYSTLTLLSTADGSERTVTGVPAGTIPGSPVWSDDGSRFALFLEREGGGLGLGIGTVSTATVTVVPELALTDMLSAPIQWIDNDTLLLTLVADLGEMPQPLAAPEGPIVQEASGKQTRAATYQDLLTSPHDEALFTYLTTVQLATYSLSTANVELVGEPVLATSARPSPDGRFLLVTRLVPPFSYRVPYNLFARRVEVWDATTGAILHTIADLPISDEVPQQGVPTGPRGIGWQPNLPATLRWVEALDGGNPLAKVEHRDRVMTATILPPKASPPLEGGVLLSSQAPTQRPSAIPNMAEGLHVAQRQQDAPVHESELNGSESFRLTHRFAGWEWPDDPAKAIVTEYDRDRRWRTTYYFTWGAWEERTTLFDLSVNDAYGDPGSFITTQKPTGERVLDTRNGKVFLAGRGATPDGDRPFLDSFDLETGEKERLFQCGDTGFESFLAFIGDKLLTSRQSRTEPTNFFVDGVALTHFTDPHPAVTGLHKELVRYQRPDGVPLSGTLYLPPNIAPDSRPNLPLLLWAYPEEYSDAATAGQVRGSDKTFTRLMGTSPLWFLLRGWAVLMDASMPIVGDPETMNDTFAEQIVGAAKAAIDTLAERGIADPGRVVVGGHSYGAFMTANLLAHAPGLFRAGIARSGAYNRTLTPFGFQSERRSYWEAAETYHRLSPFTHADKLKDPLLLIHGQADNNPGTHTVQSERFYQALQAHGATARLVLLPHESHGYRARESVLHTLWEMLTWAERFAGPIG
ncbi:alpha/beta hydrolase family protein [Armatimonas rosea]|uniref:Dipeptidyl aminopeptidase/acylaminoacyl peptidase n=1 Tax=Armatimonas rosea TaxID=685828 RepID=A0A7W9SX81_ARMRO|nr:prolyl oligopeptidase family serine peptidase [Armatimonas rosea]MBB6053593.1 dipeptidyl aminopeptidase/acylaminoacyl peptidase [Armatimonas rosea]